MKTLIYLLCLSVLPLMGFPQGGSESSDKVSHDAGETKLSRGKANTRAGSEHVLTINKLPPEGVLLDKGWKFHPGDNPNWARQEFNDTKWTGINPTKDIFDLPELFRSPICWMRIHIKVSDSLLRHSLVIQVQQAGASEIYLNGKLLHSIGVVSGKPDEVVAINPQLEPGSLPITSDKEQIVAVRFALEPNVVYPGILGYGYGALSIVVNTIENVHQFNKARGVVYQKEAITFALFSVLAVLYFAFYLFYPIQKVNLYFSIYAFLETVLWWVFLNYFELEPVHRLRYVFLTASLFSAIQIIGFYFMLKALYELLKEAKGLVFYTVLGVSALSIPAGAFVHGWGSMIPVFGIPILQKFEITRIAFKAVKNLRKGAWILASGGVCFLALWISLLLQYVGYLNPKIDFYFYAYISTPLAVAIYLGYDMAFTNQILQQKLSEVQRLSQEKQQLLISQNQTLEKEVAHRTAALQQSLTELKDTQQQLIQREKMASLGELTTGIAHEIQNPLNFVNNFSEVSKELTEELKEELSRPEPDKAQVSEITAGLEQNLDKIIHHGQRAGAIVQGMLEHSRQAIGEKQPTDINALAEEYLRLSYHGQRASDKSFEVSLVTELDGHLPRVEVVPQEIGRVLLNLYNNAFYALKEKQVHSNGDFHPQLKVSSSFTDGKVQLHVRDNGDGIPQAISSKIFQPFFTTKPAGKGTGLGLSISYDIITKLHKGEIKVQSKEGEFSEFVVELPV